MNVRWESMNFERSVNGQFIVGLYKRGERAVKLSGNHLRSKGRN